MPTPPKPPEELVRRRAEDIMEDIDFLYSVGVTHWRDMTERLGYKDYDSLNTFLRRHGRRDLIDRFRAQREEEAFLTRSRYNRTNFQRTR